MINTGDDMDARVSFLSLTLTLIMLPAFAKDIYKCTVNGVVRYSDEKCDDNSSPIKLRDIAAPLGQPDMKAIRIKDEHTSIQLLQDRVARHQKKIRHYRKQMNTELAALKLYHQSEISENRSERKKKLRNPIKDQELVTQVKNIAASTDQEDGSKQMLAVIKHYETLIKAEQFQIKLLVDEQKSIRQESEYRKK